MDNNKINQKELLKQFLSNVSIVKENIFTKSLFVSYWLEDINYHNANRLFCEAVEIDKMEAGFNEREYNYYIEEGTLNSRIQSIVSVFSSLTSWYVKDFNSKTDEDFVSELIELINETGTEE